MNVRWNPVTATIALALIAGSAPGPAPFADEPGVTVADDACHVASWADGRHDALFTEWWYFNLFDERSDLQAIVSYFVTNPSGRFGPAQVQMVAVAYTPGGVVTAVDAYPGDAFAAHAERADVRLGANSIQVLDAETYQISGASRDGRLAWDLTYARAAAPWLAGDRIPVGSLPWESMSWLVYMPRAEVTGRFVVDGREYAVSAPGYHDHNWGEWVPPHALWNWAQFSDGRLALEMGDFIRQPAGIIGVDFDGDRTVFTKEQYGLVHTRWAFDRVNRLFYPTESILSAENGARRLKVTIQAIRTEPLRGDLPFPLRDLVIYEQTARYDGTLWQKSAEGEWSVASVLRGDGFKEYTARRY